MKVSELINESLNALRRTDTVTAAREFMVEQGVTELPVLDKQHIYNYARIVNLIEFGGDEKLEDVIPFNPHAPRVFEEQHLYEVVPVLAASDLQAIGVVNENNEFVGITDQKSINKQLAQSLTYKGIGAVLLFETESRDFAPSQI